ncbi:MAG: type II toxin-antitoxin system VapC family toxin [Chloroflexi bacterium]|nr:type II toxin-antitoxin system VapC family toxin [Chloroflexota bacterium]
MVDASFALAWVLPEVTTAAAIRRLQTWQASGLTVIAPGWFMCETANGLYRKVRRGLARLADARAALRLLLRIVELRDMEPETAIRGIEIADTLGQGASYDSQYVAMAEREGCDLWTGDERFHGAAAGAFPFVRWVGET